MGGSENEGADVDVHQKWPATDVAQLSPSTHVLDAELPLSRMRTPEATLTRRASSAVELARPERTGLRAKETQDSSHGSITRNNDPTYRRKQVDSAVGRKLHHSVRVDRLRDYFRNFNTQMATRPTLSIIQTPEHPPSQPSRPWTTELPILPRPKIDEKDDRQAYGPARSLSPQSETSDTRSDDDVPPSWLIEEECKPYAALPDDKPSRELQTKLGASRTYDLELRPGTPHFKDEFLSCLTPGHKHCILELENTFSEFRLSQLSPDDNWGDLVLVNGTAGQVWAGTCDQYIKHMWPDIQLELREVFDLIGKETSCDNKVLRSAPSSPRCTASVAREDETLVVDIGSEDPTILTSLVEGVCWFSASIWNGEELPSFSKVHLKFVGDETFTVENELPTPVDPSLSGSSTCWVPLIPRSSIASDFAIPARNPTIKGMELSFELMCLLCGLEYEVSNDEGIILYGHLSIVYPVRQLENCIEWHFQPRKNKLGQIDEPEGKRLKVMPDDFAFWQEGKRHFIGLWSDPEVTLGTDIADISKVTWSEAPELHHSWTKEGRSIGGSLVLPKILNLNWSQTYCIAVNRRNPYMADFESKIHSYINTPVVLYSVKEKRAWMVSFVSVLLHIARVRARHQQVLGFYIPACPPAADGGYSAFAHIIGCFRYPLKRPSPNELLDPTEQELKIKDYLNEVWATLDCAQRESSKTSGLFRSHIVGYEMADVARLKQTLRMKKQPLDYFRTGWTPLLDEVKLTLFYEDVFDPIIARRGDRASGTCFPNAWQRIPKDFNLLTTSLPCLLNLTEHLNGTDVTGRFTKNYGWHNPGGSKPLFASCGFDKPHVCNKLQEVVFNKTNPPLPEALNDNASGALAFRYNKDIQTIHKAVESSLAISVGTPTIAFGPVGNWLSGGELSTRDSGYVSMASKSPGSQQFDETNLLARLSSQEEPPILQEDSRRTSYFLDDLQLRQPVSQPQSPSAGSSRLRLVSTVSGRLEGHQLALQQKNLPKAPSTRISPRASHEFEVPAILEYAQDDIHLPLHLMHSHGSAAILQPVEGTRVSPIFRPREGISSSVESARSSWRSQASQEAKRVSRRPGRYSGIWNSLTAPEPSIEALAVVESRPPDLPKRFCIERGHVTGEV